LVHAGVPLDYLQTQLDCLGISDEFQLRVEPVLRNGQAATKLYVDIPGDLEPSRIRDEETPHTQPSHDHAHEHPHPHSGDHHPSAPSRSWLQIEAFIRSANVPARPKAWSLATFENLARAEAAVHGVDLEAVHFHEVGATDAIVDIVGTCLGLDWLNVDAIHCSALPTGGGTVMTDHGRLPVPTPAVLKLWERYPVPVYSNGIERELVTPTGAALMVTLATQFGSAPAMRLNTLGLGAGNRNFPIPNILRLWIGEADDAAIAAIAQETIAVLETQIDDLNPQAIAYTLEELLAAGALDVFTQAIGMKKSRSGLLLSVLCKPDLVATCEAILFRETTTLGIRRSLQTRTVLNRMIQSVETPYGSVRIKLAGAGILPEQASQIQPEYEDCATLARQHNIPWREVHRLALQSWYKDITPLNRT
jgi:pyridinium-3,5-bisthiocarboxylic acid mononucleotide nickel chelatase